MEQVYGRVTIEGYVLGVTERGGGASGAQLLGVVSCSPRALAELSAVRGWMSMDTTAVRLIACLLFAQVSSHGNHFFGYTKEEQELWSEHSDACAGKYQSPIRIISHRAQRLPIPALEMVGFHNLLPGPVVATNTGHSVSLRPAVTGESWPKVFGALLLHEYQLESFHFHWGHRFSRGSEHVLNSIRFPMEMHIVHRNMKYSSLNEAMQKPDGLVVLAFFFQAQEKNNHALRPILDVLERVKFPGDSSPLHISFSLSSLLTADMDAFYTYRGSLTTPPCSESVTWVIFPDALPISFSQIKKFRRIYSSGEDRMVNNFRVLQPLNSRNVFVRKLWKIESYNLTSHDSVSWLS
ncbi:carbonic anhydrase-like [Schistocerca americana]|uniref:carbonic anhydrase-like n=1 Tax=Schistocerca americana TaxID=7009 RepID=UPI001F4FAD27|nr:carbonic anhydrase-like [Schistocerca americana]